MNKNKMKIAGLAGLVLGVALVSTLGFQGTTPYSTVFQLKTIIMSGTPGSNGIVCSPANGNQQYIDYSSNTPYSCDTSSGVFTWNNRAGGGSGDYQYVLPGTVGVAVGFTANATRVYDFNIIQSLNVSKITYSIATADNTANLYDVGIYNNSGTLLCHIGATAGTTFAPSTGTRTLSFLSPCIMPAGSRYFLANTAVTATAAFANNTNATFRSMAGTAPTSGSTTSGGVLNASITPAADNWTTSAMPYFSLHN